MYSLISTAKLNNVDPQAWLADVLGRIAGTPMAQLDDLLPWNWTPIAMSKAAYPWPSAKGPSSRWKSLLEASASPNRGCDLACASAVRTGAAVDSSGSLTPPADILPGADFAGRDFLRIGRLGAFLPALV
jgi:hypothetical protein